MVIQPEPTLPEPLHPATNSMIDDLIRYEAEYGEGTDGRFFEIPSKSLSAKTRPRFTADTVPDTDAIFESPDTDKECAICGINGLETMDLIEHWDEDHGLRMESTVEMWNDALERYEEDDDELDLNPEPSTHRQNFSTDTSVSQAISTAIQENMDPIRKDIEVQLNLLKQEILKKSESETLHNVTDNIKNLTTASSACSSKISQVEKNSSENGAAMTRMSMCQTEHSVKLDNFNSALGKIKQNLEAIQVENEHIASNQALNSKKVSAVESKQTIILEMLSELRIDSIKVQGRLEKIEKNVTPKPHDAAAKVIVYLDTMLVYMLGVE